MKKPQFKLSLSADNINKRLQYIDIKNNIYNINSPILDNGSAQTQNFDINQQLIPVELNGVNKLIKYTDLHKVVSSLKLEVIFDKVTGVLKINTSKSWSASLDFDFKSPPEDLKKPTNQAELQEKNLVKAENTGALNAELSKPSLFEPSVFDMQNNILDKIGLVSQQYSILLLAPSLMVVIYNILLQDPNQGKISFDGQETKFCNITLPEDKILFENVKQFKNKVKLRYYHFIPTVFIGSDFIEKIIESEKNREDVRTSKNKKLYITKDFYFGRVFVCELTSKGVFAVWISLSAFFWALFDLILRYLLQGISLLTGWAFNSTPFLSSYYPIIAKKFLILWHAFKLQNAYFCNSSFIFFSLLFGLVKTFFYMALINILIQIIIFFCRLLVIKAESVILKIKTNSKLAIK